MSDRRRHPRWSRRVRVRYWPPGAPEKATSGYTRDVSEGGTFVLTDRPLKPGSRLQMEFFTEDGSFLLEGVVARSLTYPRELLKVKTPGMGIRFLTVRELVQEIFPANARGGLGAHDDGTSATEALRPPGSEGDEESGPPLADQPPSAQEPIDRREVPRYPVRFDSLAQFIDSWERDLRFGGLFVQTHEPAALDRQILLLIQIPERGQEPIRMKARVVQVIPSDSGSGSPNLLAGMGVQIEDTEALQALERLARSLGSTHRLSG